jgi:4a-hydroxytetrahydrobiopterin dehydratase
MSEAGWKAFVTADGVADWVVLHGGPTAAFRTASIREAAQLAAAIAEVPGLDEAQSVLTVTDRHVSVRLTRDLWGLEPGHVDLARAVSAVARGQGARADRAAMQEVQFAIAAQPQAIDVPFWRAVLGYRPLADDAGTDPLGHSSTVWLQELDPAKSLRHAMHVDVSVARERVAARVEAALAAGGTVVDQSAQHWTLSDRAGNRVCVTAWPDGYPDPTNPSA